ncbi:hypothetical protein [Pseudogemmobacter bohemicus]|nr:hypothetical protein [Pseudogemmobacter bohemicus]
MILKFRDIFRVTKRIFTLSFSGMSMSCAPVWFYYFRSCQRMRAAV